MTLPGLICNVLGKGPAEVAVIAYRFKSDSSPSTDSCSGGTPV